MTDRSIPFDGLPPSPGLDKEEPDLWQENDIPDSDGGEIEDSAEPPPRR